MTRRLAFALAPLLLLGACGDQQPATVNESVSDSGLEQENVVAGDVTAIDAATADDAGMANDMAPPALDDGNSDNSSNLADNAA
jgi:CheY-specific phosphatase CheX